MLKQGLLCNVSQIYFYLATCSCYRLCACWCKISHRMHRMSESCISRGKAVVAANQRKKKNKTQDHFKMWSPGRLITTCLDPLYLAQNGACWDVPVHLSPRNLGNWVKIYSGFDSFSDWWRRLFHSFLIWWLHLKKKTKSEYALVFVTAC